jgi:hypothetical protein
VDNMFNEMRPAQRVMPACEIKWMHIDQAMNTRTITGQFSGDATELMARLLRERQSHIDAFLVDNGVNHETHELWIYRASDSKDVYCAAPRGTPSMTLDEAMASLPVLVININVVVDSDREGNGG